LNKDAAAKLMLLLRESAMNEPELTLVVAALQITGVSVKAWKSRMESKAQ